MRLKKLVGAVNKFGSNNKDICNTIEENNVKMCNEIKKAIKETNVKQTFAEAIKTKPALRELNKQLPVIIKPKEKQNIEKTKEDLNKKVDPADLKITNVENRRNGTMIIQSETNEEREKIKTAIQNGMSEEYEIKVPDSNEMSVTITDMTFKYTENEIIEKIKKQNNMLKDSEIKPVRFYEFKRNNKVIYNAKIQIDNESYTKILLAEKINIGWERCRVFDGTEIIMCYKCKGFNHRSVDCRNQEICHKCHGNHRSKDCNEEAIVKCVNCVRSNKNLNLGLDENHVTTSKICPVYQNKLNIKKRRMGLNV